MPSNDMCHVAKRARAQMRWTLRWIRIRLAASAQALPGRIGPADERGDCMRLPLSLGGCGRAANQLAAKLQQVAANGSRGAVKRSTAGLFTGSA